MSLQFSVYDGCVAIPFSVDVAGVGVLSFRRGSETGEDWDVQALVCFSQLIRLERLNVFDHLVVHFILGVDAIGGQVGKVWLSACCSMPILGTDIIWGLVAFSKVMVLACICLS